jgi:hypothetical protein
MKCPYCHEDFATWVGHDAHVSSCAYKDNPLPEPETGKDGDNGSNDDGLDKMMVAELKAIAEGLGIEVPKKPKKAELIEAIREARAEFRAAAEYYGGEGVDGEDSEGDE